MRVLIVSLRAGEGHVKAAQALEEAFRFKYPFTTVKRVDFFDYSSKIIKKLYGDLYLLVAKRAPGLHNFLYETLNLIKDKKARYGRILFDTMNARLLLDLIEEFDPDVIVATHPVPAGVVRMFQKNGKKTPIVIVITDYELHQLWIDENISFYIVASEQVKKELEKEGIAKELIYPLGIPLRLDFTKQLNKAEAREKFKFSDLFTVFVLAGAFGSSPAQEILEHFKNMTQRFQAVVVAGRNRELFSSIERMKDKFSFPIHLFGFTDQMADLMSASDILISKPGGLTVTESLAKKLPMLIIKGFAGQEEANTRHLLSHQCAVKAESFANIPGIIEDLIAKPQKLSFLRKNISNIAKPNAALEAVEMIWKKA